MKKTINFKDENTFKNLERQAYDGTIDISDFPAAEFKYFYKLKELYAHFKFLGCPKEDAVRIKTLLMKQYADDVYERDTAYRIAKKYQDNIKIAHIRLADINGSRDALEIAMFACEIVGAMMGDDSFANLQKRKFEK